MKAIRAKRAVKAPGVMVDDALVVFAGGHVAACEPWHEERRNYNGPVMDLGPVTVCAGVFNMHVHLELSHLVGATVSGQGFGPWVKSLLALPVRELDPQALDSAVAQMQACGTVFTVDIGDRNQAMVGDALDQAGLGYVLGVEFFGFKNQQDLVWPATSQQITPKQWPRVSAAGHALYSTDVDTLRAAKAWDQARGRLFPMHLAEHQGEVQLLADGTGDFADLLRVRVLPKDFTAPGCTPVAYAKEQGLLSPGTLAVHCVQLTPSDIDILAQSGAAVCLCPRSNDYIGVGKAPWEALAKSNVPLCLGTDSLSSNTDVNIWNEALAVVEQSGGAISPAQVLEWLTLSPARILNLENSYGTLESGRVAGYSIIPDELASAL